MLLDWQWLRLLPQNSSPMGSHLPGLMLTAAVEGAAVNHFNILDIISNMVYSTKPKIYYPYHNAY